MKADSPGNQRTQSIFEFISLLTRLESAYSLNKALLKIRGKLFEGLFTLQVEAKAKKKNDKQKISKNESKHKEHFFVFV